MTAHAITLGSVEGGWVYPYTQWADLAIVAVWLLYSAGAAATLMIPWRVAEHRPWWTLVTWIVVATALQWILRTMAPYPLEAQFASDNANSFHSVAEDYDAADLLTRHGRVRLNAPLHVQSNMPGKLLLTEGLHHGYGARGCVAMARHRDLEPRSPVDVRLRSRSLRQPAGRALRSAPLSLPSGANVLHAADEHRHPARRDRLRLAAARLAQDGPHAVRSRPWARSLRPGILRAAAAGHGITVPRAGRGRHGAKADLLGAVRRSGGRHDRVSSSPPPRP